MSKVPIRIAQALAALFLVCGGAVYIASEQPMVVDKAPAQVFADAYFQMVQADPDTSMGVKVAMLLGHYYESSGKHIGTPYIDKLGRGQPLTVCNGITGDGVVQGRWYTQQDCYLLEKGRYLQAERDAQVLFVHWQSYDPIVQGQFLDFIHNKGIGNLQTSTLLAKANAGDLQGACAQNTRWTKGRINGVSTVLNGLVIRANANAELCANWRALL